MVYFSCNPQMMCASEILVDDKKQYAIILHLYDKDRSNLIQDLTLISIYLLFCNVLRKIC